MKLELLPTQRADRVREMLVELENIKKDGYKLNLREHKKRDHGRRETSSFIVEYEVYGREEDKENIVKLLLLTEANQGRGVSCVAIIGLGGLGKTTLAQLAFNDQRVTQHFDVKIWVFVSDHFDAKNILMAVIESVSEKKSRHSTMEGLHSEVWGLLHKKRYLIVLDDVWTDDQGEWDKLIPLFRGGVDGSKIMVTTRSERVALMMNSLTFPYFLKGLSEDACWSLFMQRAFQPGKEEKHPDLLPIGREIVKKCGGVALAAKTLGSLMRLKRERREWLAVQDSELWNLDESESGILPALRLSYDNLPLHLKRCFSFCSIIPRGYEINKEKLIRQWVAAGLIRSGRRGEPPEDIGNNYFNHFLWISFFREVRHCVINDGVGCNMHDVIYDLAQYVAGTTSMILYHGSPHGNCAQVLHTSVVRDSRSSSMIPEALYEAKQLRTLLLFSNGNFTEAPHELFSSFECLHELDLSGCGLELLDHSIGEHLLLLRYLDLSHTHIKELPSSIEQLHYLLTLDVSGCYNLEALPNLANMSSLRHLNTTGCDSLTTMLPMIEPFQQKYSLHITPVLKILIKNALPKSGNQLQTLPLFVVGGILDLLFLEWLHLHGSLKIIHLDNASQNLDSVLKGLDSEYKGLKEMCCIDSLELHWGYGCDLEEESVRTIFQERKQNRSSRQLELPELNDPDPCGATHILKCMQPHQNLKRLVVKDFPGYIFPPWISLINLTAIKLIDYRYCQFLPSLGNLSLLNNLLLQGMHGLRYIDKYFYGESTRKPFPALRELALIDFLNLEEWSNPNGGNAFPNLVKFVVNKCPKLKVMPKFISNIQYLELWDCSATLFHSFQNLTFLKVLVIQDVVTDLSSPHLGVPANNLLPGMDRLNLCGQTVESIGDNLDESTLRLARMQQVKCIEHLELKDCSETLVNSFQNLTSLKVLVIERVRNLSSFTGAFPTNNVLLTSLEIKSCPKLCSLPTFGGLTVLKSLTIQWCENLSYLPEGMQNLNALESLEIGDCHKLMFLPEIGTGGFCKLRTLSIENCSNLTSLTMGLKNLKSLEHLIIMYCPSLVTLPDRLEHLVALQSLTILACSSEFKSFPEELQKLTGLHSLEIRSCPGLEALPEWIEKLISLRSLAISDCHSITFLPEGIKHLSGLQHLSIQDCPSVLERCIQEGGEDWPKISHIPYKHIGLPNPRQPTEASTSSN